MQSIKKRGNLRENRLSNLMNLIKISVGASRQARIPYHLYGLQSFRISAEGVHAEEEAYEINFRSNFQKFDPSSYDW